MPQSTSKPLATRPSSTITPQRKHRKLLKDGSGSEVWPESVEKIFVDGLRKYWESPWATYSRGRSRWRNQYLVDYLHKAGIHRSKKQVASHMQVLRNMWKGEPEFHLVAGGEELFHESGLLAPVKKEDPDPNPLIPIDGDDSDSLPSASPSTPTDIKLPSPPHPPYSSNLVPINHPSPSTPPSDFFETQHDLVPPPMSQPMSQHPGSTFTPQYPNNSYTLISGPSTSIPPVPKLGSTPPIGPEIFTPFSRLSTLCLWAEGMSPYNLSIDSLRSTGGRSLSPVHLQISLSIPSIDDIHSLSTLHGFHGAVTFTAPWSSSAHCVTKAYAGDVCISEEADNLQLVSSNPTSSADACQITGFLPTESSLSRSRWFDATVQTSITQEITIDRVLLAFIVYDLERRVNGSSPAAELTGFQNYRPPPLIRPTASPSFTYPTTAYGLHPHSQLMRFRQPALSCVYSPVTTRPTSMVSSMLF